MADEKEQAHSQDDVEKDEEDVRQPTGEVETPIAKAMTKMSTPRLCLTLGILWFTVLLGMIDETITATLVRQISISLDAVDKFSWITNTYLLGQAVSQQISGHLTEIFGRRSGLLLCMTLLWIGTLICGLSPDFGVFVFARLLQGLGAGSTGTILAFVEADIIPMERRSLVEGGSNILVGAALALGGLYGGYINLALSWRWAFYIQAPVIFATTVAIFFFVKSSNIQSREVRISWKKASSRIDIVGMILVVSAIVLLQLGLTSGATKGNWNQALVIAPLVVAGCALIAFIIWELHFAVEPVIPLRLLRERTIALVHIASFLSNAAVYTYLFYIPVYVQVHGGDTARAGLRMVPFAAGVAFGSTVCGLAVAMIKRYYVPGIGTQMVGVAVAAMLFCLRPSWGGWATYFAMALVGCFWGASFVVFLMSLLTSIRPEHQAVVQASIWTVRSMGMTVGLAIAGSIFQAASHGSISSAQLQGLDNGTPLPENVRKEEFLGLHRVFIAGLCFTCLGAAASFGMANNKISNDQEGGEAIN